MYGSLGLSMEREILGWNNHSCLSGIDVGKRFLAVDAPEAEMELLRKQK